MPILWVTPKDDLCVLACCEFCEPSRFTSDHEEAVAGGRGLPSPFLSRLRITCGGKIMSKNEDDVKNDFDNDLGDDFDYQPNAEDDAEDDDVDSLDSTSKSEEVCGVKRIGFNGGGYLEPGV
ncbi:hypothetical protein Ahy_B03g063110 [Arachis hypogaea]|uniref:Uncharacterized protein n=1 Tax=Arachis hypogaea TaxID=3818 RepID=A0A444ZWE3_ARAHY|nr:hypothetical protein Ahy_B03g063110 [Arachis hypogaea]